MQDFLRMQGFALLSGLATFLVILIGFHFAIGRLQQTESKDSLLVQRTYAIRRITIQVLLALWVFWMTQVYFMNSFPKNTIDRTVVDSRADNLEKNAQERLQEQPNQ
jgi:hypothetical protein